MAFNLKIIVVVGICSFICVAAQGADTNVQCVNDLIQWCSGMKKGTNFQGNFMTTDYSSSGESRTVHCMAGRGGINCTLNNSPWFACRPDGSVTYKGYVLQENSPVSDDDVCDASKKASNMFTYDSAEVEAAMNAGKEMYQRTMDNVRSTMNNVQRSLSRQFQPCFPFCGSNPFSNGFPFNG